jgi:signal peptidase I
LPERTGFRTDFNPGSITVLRLWPGRQVIQKRTRRPTLWGFREDDVEKGLPWIARESGRSTPRLHAARRIASIRAMFTPKWATEAKLLHKGAKKFLNYKRDLLKPDRIEEIESRRADLLAAIKAGDQPKAAEAGKQLRNTCEKALPSFPVQVWWEEQVEVIWVALVIALGLRAYVLQPFRIPTGSMQPTLNGISVHSFENPDQKAPGLLQRGWEMLSRGRTYQTIVATADGHIDGVEDKSWFLFTRTAIHMSDGSTIMVSAARNEAEIPFRNKNTGDRIQFHKGETIFNGYLDTGDLVLVDKISYNFRQPKRGEVFVFDTRALHTNGHNSKNLADQEEGTHFIKRLVAVPGDTVQVTPPNLLINGLIPNEPGIRRVMDGNDIYGQIPGVRDVVGYQIVPRGYAADYPGAITSSDKVVKLADQDAPRGMREYMAMGDNTGKSLDSRFWGPVKEYNLVGTGFFSLWPFTTGHWGFIH